MKLESPLLKLSPALVMAACALCAPPARATTINFDDLGDGDILAGQYASLGVLFSANAFSGANSNSTPQGWATNTDMTVALSTGPNALALGTPSLVSGNVLHGVDGWLGENGDPSFLITFSTPIRSFSIDFASVSGLQSAFTDCAIYLYNGATLLATVTGPTPASDQVSQFTLSYAAPSITKVAVAPGSYGDWVAVDNIVFAPVPEPASTATFGLGLAAVGMALRRRRH
jgi:hypothetical protein